MQFYKGKRFAVFRNFRVISMRFAVFLRYSVRYLHVFLCGFAVLVPPLRPPLAVLCGHHTPADTHLEIFLSWSEFSEGQLSIF